MKVLVFLRERLIVKQGGRGGPYGVGYYLLKEKQRRKIDNIIFLNESDNRRFVIKETIYNNIPSSIRKFVWQIRTFIKFHSLLSNNKKKSDFLFDEYDAIHFHITYDMFKVREPLEKFKGKVLLTSHSPVPFAQEMREEQLSELSKRLFKRTYSRLPEIDSYAFRRADYIVFPCPEAEESYLKNWEEYKKIKEEKKDCYRYIPTGIAPKIAVLSRNEVRKKYDIPNEAFLISFMGRHNKIKGYDILKDVARVLFDKSDEYRVIAAGNEEPLKRLQHKYWTEVGYTKDPYSLIAASDVYFLPNRETYFDLVMLEALSLKKIVIASRTGGNKFFEKNNVKGVFLYDTLDEAIKLLKQIKNMPKAERETLGEENYQFFLNKLTDEVYFENYMKLIEEIGKKNEI